MDVMVQWDDSVPSSAAFARVRAVTPKGSFDARARDVVTLYGMPTPESLALALAATLEARKVSKGSSLTTGDLNLSESEGAVGAAAWLDRDSGELIRRELAIPFTVLLETAHDLLAEAGQSIRRVLAGLLMPDWPEGTRRALTFQLVVAGAPQPPDLLATMREADADNFTDDS